MAPETDMYIMSESICRGLALHGASHTCVGKVVFGQKKAKLGVVVLQTWLVVVCQRTDQYKAPEHQRRQTAPYNTTAPAPRWQYSLPVVPSSVDSGASSPPIDTGTNKHTSQLNENEVSHAQREHRYPHKRRVRPCPRRPAQAQSKSPCMTHCGGKGDPLCPPWTRRCAPHEHRTLPQ